MTLMILLELKYIILKFCNNDNHIKKDLEGIVIFTS